MDYAGKKLCAVLAGALVALGICGSVHAADDGLLPRYVVDPYWPKPLPNGESFGARVMKWAAQ